MDERDFEPEQSAPRHLVDQLHPRRSELLERLPYVVRLESDVMHAGPAPGDEAADVRGVAGGSDELEAALADHERCSDDTLLAERVTALESSTEESLVHRDRLVEIGYRDAEMVDAACTHSLDATYLTQVTSCNERRLATRKG